MELHKRLKVLSVEQGRHMEILAAEALQRYLDKEGKVNRAARQ